MVSTLKRETQIPEENRLSLIIEDLESSYDEINSNRKLGHQRNRNELISFGNSERSDKSEEQKVSGPLPKFSTIAQ